MEAWIRAREGGFASFNTLLGPGLGTSQGPIKLFYCRGRGRVRGCMDEWMSGWIDVLINRTSHLKQLENCSLNSLRL